MSAITLVDHMKFHGFVFADNAFYECYGDRVFTVDQAMSWLKYLEV